MAPSSSLEARRRVIAKLLREGRIGPAAQGPAVTRPAATSVPNPASGLNVHKSRG
jgi:hypothetical protein